LLSQIGHRVAGQFAQRLEPLGIHPRHFALLNQLAQRDGQTQQELADSLGVHRNAMVGLVDDLQERGFIKREPHPDDRRAHAVRLTTPGRKLLPAANRVADELEAEVTTGLTKTDRERLVGQLRQIATETGLAPGIHPSLNKSQ
jgi:DNA-binding MarR family transcriptional regulator